MKQTAVEWLIKAFNLENFEATCNFAKAIEKEQIKNAFVECWKANVPDGSECKLDAEQYYTETYESNT